MKKQRIQWSTVIRKPSEEERRERRSSVLEAAVFDVFFALIFQTATLLLLENYYKESRFFLIGLFWFFVIDLLICVTFAARNFLSGKQETFVQIALVALGFGSFAFVLFKNAFWKEVISGLGGMTTDYIRRWNYYYEMAVPTPGGKLEHAPQAITLLLLLLFFFTVWSAKNSSEFGRLAVIPLAVFGLQLLVGESSDGMGILLVFAGIVLKNSRGFSWTDFRPFLQISDSRIFMRQRMTRISSMVLLTVFFIIIGLLSKNSAQRQMADHYEAAGATVEKTVEKVVNWELWTEIEGPEEAAELLSQIVDSMLEEKEDDRAVIDNEKPEFKNTPYLLVTMAEKPKNRLYLKGFSAGIYKNGIWENEEEIFKRACREAGYDSEDMAEEIANLPMIKLKKLYQVNQLRNTGIQAELRYYKPNTDMAYVPYFADTSQSDLFAVREGDYEKATRTEQFEFTLWQNGGNYTEQLSSFASVGKLDWEEWYEEYVQSTYLEVPEHLVQVRALASQLKERPYTGAEIKATRTNQKRLAYAAVAADWLGRNTTYSQVLTELPKGTDPIEYFLETSRKGYCMHYASAGTMLLRALGVPARYASGYIAGASSFSGQYAEKPHAVVLDNQAHAWVEIYLEGVGWVPIEVTGGYAQLLPVPSPTPTLKPTNTPKPTTAEIPTSVPVETQIPEGGTEPTKPPEITVTLTPAAALQLTPSPTVSGEDNLKLSPTPMQTGAAENPDREELQQEDADMSLDGVLRRIGTYGLFIFIAVGLFFFLKWLCRFFSPLQIFTRRLIREVHRNGNAAGIRMINRKVYQKLLQRGKIKQGISDKLLEDTVRNLYCETKPEAWDNYFRLVLEATYSNIKLTEEDMLFCYRLYRDVISKQPPKMEAEL